MKVSPKDTVVVETDLLMERTGFELTSVLAVAVAILLSVSVMVAMFSMIVPLLRGEAT